MRACKVEKSVLIKEEEEKRKWENLGDDDDDNDDNDGNGYDDLNENEMASYKVQVYQIKTITETLLVNVKVGFSRAPKFWNYNFLHNFPLIMRPPFFPPSTLLNRLPLQLGTRE